MAGRGHLAAGRGHLAAGTNNLGSHRKPRSRRCRRRAAAEQQDTTPALQGLIAEWGPGSPGGRERCYLTTCVAAGSLSWRMAPLSRSLIGSKSHESCGQMAGAAPGTGLGGGKEGKLHSWRLHWSLGLRQQNCRERAAPEGRLRVPGSQRHFQGRRRAGDAQMGLSA